MMTEKADVLGPVSAFTDNQPSVGLVENVHHDENSEDNQDPAANKMDVLIMESGSVTEMVEKHLETNDTMLNLELNVGYEPAQEQKIERNIYHHKQPGDL